MANLKEIRSLINEAQEENCNTCDNKDCDPDSECEWLQNDLLVKLADELSDMLELVGE